jgi:hypothetical protein
MLPQTSVPIRTAALLALNVRATGRITRSLSLKMYSSFKDLQIGYD